MQDSRTHIRRRFVHCLRLENNVPRHVLAGYIGITVSDLMKLEIGEAAFGDQTTLKIEAYFGQPLRRLVSEATEDQFDWKVVEAAPVLKSELAAELLEASAALSEAMGGSA